MRRGSTSVRGNIKRSAKIAVKLLYFIALQALRFALRARGRSLPKPLIVLYYHGILASCRSNFVRQLESIRRWARVSPASDRGSLPSGKPLPEPAARDFHSTIFVPVGALGHRPTWPIEHGSPAAGDRVMSAEQIAKLPSLLVTLGSHTRTHPRLSRLPPVMPGRRSQAHAPILET